MANSWSRTLSTQYREIRDLMRTREFWVYFVLIAALLGLLIGLAYVASGFDELTRQQALLAIACRAGDAQLLSIIIGGMAFVLLSLFTLGEVVLWFEENRQARQAGLQYRGSKWRPVLFVIGALGLGIGGFAAMASWCH